MGLSLSYIIRKELVRPHKVITGHIYNTILTAHALMMIFFMVMPVLIGGFGNYLLPIMLGCSDLIFPRLNILSLSLLPMGLIFLLVRFVREGGRGTGWTFYPPLSSEGHGGISVDLRIFRLHIAGISRIVARLNFMTTVLKGKGSLTLESLVLMVWTLVVTALLLIIRLPVLACGITMLLFDRTLNTSFFEARGGGNALIFQHLFWFFGHPEVYILILPAFGIISHSTMALTGKDRVERSLGMIYRIMRIGLIGCVVWRHHMYMTGIDADRRAYFTAATMVIAIPTGIKVYTWLLTIRETYMKWTPVLCWTFGFLFMFTFGGVTGVILSNAVMDITIHDTYFVVGHFHYVLSMGAVFGIFTGIRMYWPYVRKLAYQRSMMQGFFNQFFIGVNITFIPMHFLGLHGCPRKYKQLPIQFQKWARVRTFGATMSTFRMWFFMAMFSETLISHRLIMSLNSAARSPESTTEVRAHTFCEGVTIYAQGGAPSKKSSGPDRG